MKIIIIGHNAASDLGLARSVGRLGCEVVLLYSRPLSSSRDIVEAHSRYINECHKFKDWSKESLIEFLLAYKTVDGNKPFLVMTDDKSAYWVASSLEKLTVKYNCPQFGYDEWPVEKIFDKSFQKIKAIEAGFDVVDSWTIDLRNSDYFIPEEITYPCYVKGTSSFNTPKGLQKRCDSSEELNAQLALINKKYPSVVLVEPFVSIDKECGIMAYCDGDTVITPALVHFETTGSKKRPGVSMIGRAIPLSKDNELYEHAQSFLKSLNIHGICNIDLFEVNGHYYFVELNLRYAAYSYGICQGGVNLPAKLVGLESLDQNNILTKETSYCNETIATERFGTADMSFNDMCSLHKLVDASCVYADDDKSPYRSLVFHAIIDRIKIDVLKLLRRVK